MLFLILFISAIIVFVDFEGKFSIELEFFKQLLWTIGGLVCLFLFINIIMVLIKVDKLFFDEDAEKREKCQQIEKARQQIREAFTSNLNGPSKGSD